MAGMIAVLCRRASLLAKRMAAPGSAVAVALAFPLAAHADAGAGFTVSSILPALIGGALLGVAASLLLWLNGRIAGVSSIAAGLVAWQPGDLAWRLLFLGGIVVGGAAYYLLHGSAPEPRAGFPAWLLAAAGLLVGFGTSFGSGCTSGHGICGLARLSERSLFATGTFLVTGIVAASVTRQIFGIY